MQYLRYLISAIVLSLHVGPSIPLTYPVQDGTLFRYGSHYLYTFEPDEGGVRKLRCAPCANDERRTDVSNYVDPDYRGNGADNLGYDWSPQAWGGLAFPPKQKDKPNESWNRGRDGRQMQDWNRDQRSDRDRDRGRDRDHGCERCGPGWETGRDWNERSRRPNEETTVTSPQLVFRDDNRIAYVPSQNGDMHWDGMSGGGMRWDGFSNGVSWIGRNQPWNRDRDGGERSNRPGYVPSSQRPGNDYRDRNYGPSGFRPWDDTTKGASGWDNSGKGYYFANDYSSGSEPNNYRDKGYASSWHYTSANQNGWNGNDTKWNYGGKRWDQGGRDDNRYYPNRNPDTQDRKYGPSGQPPFSSHYPSQSSGYPNDYRPSNYPPARPGYPSVPDKNYLPNDRYPTSSRPDQSRPWDYSSSDRFDSKDPGYPRPGWVRPVNREPGYGRPDSSGKYPPPQQTYLPQDKYPPQGGYDKDKYPPPSGYDKDKPNRYDYKSPWSSRPTTGYNPSRPDFGNNFPYGGNRYPSGSSGPSGSYPQDNRPPPKGHYTGFITDITQGFNPQPGGSYPGQGNRYPDNRYPDRDKDRYPAYEDRYPNKDRYPGYNDRDRDRYPSSQYPGTNDRYPNRDKDRYPGYDDRDKDRYPAYDRDRYPGSDRDKDRYPGNDRDKDRYPGSDRYPSNPGSGDYDRGPNPGSDDNNSWNYDEHKDGVYRRAGGSYPPYRGGQYYTSSYLASASTPAGASQAGPENKTPIVTKPDDVTEPTSGTK